MAGPPVPWDLCLLRPLALALSPRAAKGFPEPHPCPLTAGPAGTEAWGGGTLRPGWPPLPLGSGDGDQRGKVATLQESVEARVGGIMDNPGLWSVLAWVDVKWPLGRRFYSSLLQPGVKS